MTETTGLYFLTWLGVARASADTFMSTVVCKEGGRLLESWTRVTSHRARWLCRLCRSRRERLDVLDLHRDSSMYETPKHACRWLCAFMDASTQIYTRCVDDIGRWCRRAQERGNVHEGRGVVVIDEEGRYSRRQNLEHLDPSQLSAWPQLPRQPLLPAVPAQPPREDA